MASYFSTFLNIYCMDEISSHVVACTKSKLLNYYKFEKIGGREARSRFSLTGSRAFSGTYAAASAMADNGASVTNDFEWNIPTGTLTGIIDVPFADDALSSGDNDSAARAAKNEMDKGSAEFGNFFNRKLLGEPGFRIGTARYEDTAGSPTGFPAFCLRFEVDPNQSVNLQVGDHVAITASTDDGTEAGDNPVGLVGRVLTKDDELGYVQMATIAAPTVAANPGSWVDNTTYSVYRQGELDSTGNVGAQLVSWGYYAPLTKQTDSKFGVDRSINSALSGMRLPTGDPAFSGSLPSRVKRLLAIMYEKGALEDEAVTIFNPMDWETFGSQLDSQTRREPVTDAKTGYSKYSVNSINGTNDVIAEPRMLRGSFLILDPKQLTLQTANGKVMQMVTAPGQASPWQLRDGANTSRARPVCLNRHIIGPPFAHGRGLTT